MTDQEDESKSYVIEQRDGIEIYAGKNGHIVMKQESAHQEESVIFIHPDDADKVIRFIQLAKKEAAEIREAALQH